MLADLLRTLLVPFDEGSTPGGEVSGPRRFTCDMAAQA